MNTNSSSFLRTDNNAIIRENAILWVKKMDECLQICMKTNGCDGIKDTHNICKIKNPTSYYKLNAHFQEKNT